MSSSHESDSVSYLPTGLRMWPSRRYAEMHLRYYLRPNHTVFKVPDDLTDDMVAPANCAPKTPISYLPKISSVNASASSVDSSNTT